MQHENEGGRGPHLVDRHVGLRIRMRRKALGVTQEKLAGLLGLTFQQVQKYERASNRVSASKLWEMSRALNAPVAYFYGGIDEDAAPSDIDGSVHAFLMTSEGQELAALFPRITEPRARRKVLELIRVLAESEDEALVA